MAPLIQFSSAAALDCKRNLDPPLSFTAFKTLHIITCGKADGLSREHVTVSSRSSSCSVVALCVLGACTLRRPASFKEIRWRRSRTQGQAHGSRGRRRRTRPASGRGAPKNECHDHRGARLLGDISKPGVTRRTPSQPTPHAGPHAAPAVFQARGFHSAHTERFVTDRATYTLVGPPELRWGNYRESL